MPLIRISHAASYDAAAKENIIHEVTAAYAAAANCDPSKVWLLLEEVPREDWGTGGTSLAAKDQLASAG